MSKKFIIVIFIFFPSITAAQEEKFENCHKLSTDYIRLMCYDKETGYNKTNSPTEKTEKTPESKAVPIAKAEGKQWRYLEEGSALENRKDAWLSVISENTEGNSIGSPIRATLFIRCMENKTNLLIAFDRYTSDNQNMRYKLDDGPIQTQWVEVMRGGDGIGIWSGSRAIPFVKKMFDKTRMVIAYNTYSGPVEFSFNISGLRSRIDKVANACGWTP